MKITKLLIPLLFIIFATSCNTLRVRTSVHYAPNDIENIVLLPVMIGEFKQPVLPLLDAAAFNSKTNTIAEDIMLMQEQQLDHMEAHVLKTLTRKFPNIDIINTEKLDSLGKLTVLREMDKREAFYTGNDDFPKVLVKTKGANPFPYTKGKVNQYFDENMEARSYAVNICKELDVDAIAVSFSNLRVSGVGIFGITGALRICSYYITIDKNGSIVAKGEFVSPLLSIEGSKLIDYKVKFEEFYPNFDKLIYDIVNPVNQ